MNLSEHHKSYLVGTLLLVIFVVTGFVMPGSDMIKRLDLLIYDRILPLAYGRVLAEGIRLTYLPMEVEEIFWRQLRNREFDISESSFSSYVMLRSRGDERFIAIPVFTSRLFRHACVFINTQKGIHAPQDLKGKIVGLPEYQITAVVWLRTWLA